MQHESVPTMPSRKRNPRHIPGAAPPTKKHIRQNLQSIEVFSRQKEFRKVISIRALLVLTNWKLAGFKMATEINSSKYLHNYPSSTSITTYCMACRRATRSSTTPTKACSATRSTASTIATS